MKKPLEVIVTKDGSRTLFSNHYCQPFHSLHGALTESKTVFLEGAEVEELFNSKDRAHILEIGFGAGLNWLLTVSLAHKYQTHLTYTALDQEIPNADLLTDLRYGDLVGQHPLSSTLIDWRQKFPDKIPNGRYHLTFDNHSNLDLFIDDIPSIFLPQNTFDRLYLDAFAPKVNPRLWSLNFFRKLYDSLQCGGILATYSSAGNVRRALTASGFTVTRRPGPPGKREMLAAKKPD